VLAYCFSESHQFAAKTDQNSVFLYRDPHILDWLYITVPLMSLYGFPKFLNFHSKFIGRQFATQTDRSSIFFGRDPPILDWLYITVLYMSFYGF
jgi:hypothetical protein